jgi:TonB family protein
MKQTFLIIFCLLSAILAKAQQPSKSDLNGGAKIDSSAKGTDTAPIFVAVEKAPDFPGGLSAFYRFLQYNLVYPSDAEKKRIQGKVFVTFVVEKDGTLSNITLARGVSADIDAEALRVIKNSPRWVPGVQNGRLVRVQFSMPINFKLPPLDTIKKLDTATRNQPIDNKIFSAVQREPMFKGGIRALDSYLHQTINYPEKAKKNHMQGIAYITFVIERDGSLSDIRVAKSSGSDDLDAEAVRVMKICPNWYPGIQNDRYVRVQYTVPIRFSLGNN